jgi:hypothetical protein
MFVNGSGRNEQSLLRTFHRWFLPIFGSFGLVVSEEKIFRNRPIRNKNWLWRRCLLTNRNEMRIFLEDRPQMLPTKFRFIWPSSFRGEDLKIWPIRNKNRQWRTCLLTDRDEMSNRYREPSIDASYHVSVHLALWFQRRRVKKIDQLETRIACGGHVC